MRSSGRAGAEADRGVATSRLHVVVHVAVSLDGATTGFDPNVERFYELARMWREDVTLVGADTILAQEEALAAVPRPGPAADGSAARRRRRARGSASGRRCATAARGPACSPCAPATRSTTGSRRRANSSQGTNRVDLAAAIGALAARAPS